MLVSRKALSLLLHSHITRGAEGEKERGRKAKTFSNTVGFSDIKQPEKRNMDVCVHVCTRVYVYVYVRKLYYLTHYPCTWKVCMYAKTYRYIQTYMYISISVPYLENNTLFWLRHHILFFAFILPLWFLWRTPLMSDECKSYGYYNQCKKLVHYQLKSSFWMALRKETSWEYRRWRWLLFMK